MSEIKDLRQEIEDQKQKISEFEVLQKEHKKIEMDLRESEDRYWHIIESVTDYIYTVYIENGFAVRTAHGPLCKAITGYSFEEFNNDQNLWIKIVYNDDVHIVNDQIYKILSAQKVSSIEHRIIRKDGVVRWIKNTPAIHYNLDGSLISYDGLISDITERKIVEIALKESEEKYRNLVESIDVGIAIIDENENFIFSNPACDKIFGKEKGSLIRHNYFDFIDQEQQSFIREQLSKTKTGTESIYESVIRKHDNDRRIVRVTSKPKFDSFSRFKDSMNIFYDITDMKRAEDALRKSEEKFSKAFQVSPALLAIYSLKENCFLEVNNRFLEATGLTRDKIMGHSFDDLSSEGVEFSIQIEKVISQEKMENYEIIFHSKTGDEKIGLLSSELFNFNNQPCLYIAISDVTKEMKLQDELQKVQKLESIGVLAGGIAHNFNNMLTTILGNISLAKIISEPASKIRKRMEEAEKSILRARDLSSQLITFAKGGAPIKTKINIAELIKNIVTCTLVESKIECKFSIPDQIWSIECDDSQMKQAISNIIINAKESMKEDGVMNIGIKNIILGPENIFSLKQGRYIVISIKDYGEGIPEENLSKIFDPFFTTRFQGRGIGLSIVYSIVSRHNGYIDVESTPNEGSEFFIYLPAINE